MLVEPATEVDSRSLQEDSARNEGYQGHTQEAAQRGTLHVHFLATLTVR